MKIIIDTDEIQLAINEAGKIVVTSEGEKPLLLLLEYQEKIENAIEEAKKVVEQKAKDLNKNLQTIIADHIKVMYRSYGAKYEVDESLIKSVPRNLFTSEIGIVLKDKLPFDIVSDLEKLGAEVKTTKLKGVLKKSIKYVVNTKAVDQYIDEYKGQFPTGIVESDRQKQLSFRLKGEDDRPEIG